MIVNEAPLDRLQSQIYGLDQTNLFRCGEHLKIAVSMGINGVNQQNIRCNYVSDFTQKTFIERAYLEMHMPQISKGFIRSYPISCMGFWIGLVAVSTSTI